MDGLYLPIKEDVEFSHEDEYLEKIEIKEETEHLEEIEIKKEVEDLEVESVGMSTRRKDKRSSSNTHVPEVTPKTKKLKPHTQEMHQDSLEEGKSSYSISDQGWKKIMI